MPSYDGVLTSIPKQSTIAGSELSACEREVILLMRETVKRNRGRATFVVEFVGTAWHVLVASPPIHIKLP